MPFISILCLFLENKNQLVPKTLKISLANSKRKYGCFFGYKTKGISDLNKLTLIRCMLQCNIHIRWHALKK